MKRRGFIALLGGAVTLPLVAHAQRPPVPVIGFLGSESPDAWASRVRAFHQGLGETGYVEGKNVAVEYRWAEGQEDRLPALAADLVHRQVAVIVATGVGGPAQPGAPATIPIVFQIGGDPVAAGLVKSLSRPAGNLTGATSLNVELGPKKLELLHDVVPAAKVIAALVNPAGPNAGTDAREFQAAARALGLELHILHASTQHDFETIFASLVQLRAGGLVIGTDAFLNTPAERLAELSVLHAVPSVFQFREFVAAGGLMSYGDSITERSPTGGDIHRPDPQGRETGRSAGPAGNKDRAVHQPQDRQGARPHRPGRAAHARRRGDRMRRREFITLLGGAACWPLAARAQQPAIPVIGFVSPRSLIDSAELVAAFRQGLKEAGYFDGQNAAIEFRWADGQYDRLPALAADLVRRQVSVIAAVGSPAAVAAKSATTTIPIVFSAGFDAVELGLVASLNRPGGNVTGVTNLNTELGPKRLELLHEVLPARSIMAALVNPTNPNAETVSRDLRAAASTLGLQLNVLLASTEGEIDAAFADLVHRGATALVVGADNFFNSRVEQLAALSIRYAVPTVFQFREFAAAGGLMSYGGSNADFYRQVGVYTGRVLKGEKPADLPIQQSTKVELILNLRTAKALGLTVPLSLLTRADEVIE
jgi:putative ABC transport system substrate-binding protein